MHILIIGATGMIGSRILKEAVDRGHTVTALARNVEKAPSGPRVRVIAGDAADTPQLIALAAGQDAIVTALSPRGDRGKEVYLAGIRSALGAVKASQTPYVLFVGGTFNLFTSNGRRILDQMLELHLPPERMAEPAAVAEARAIVETSDVNWTFFCPGGKIAPGERTGKFRLGGTHVNVEPWTDASISAEDYAVAAVDELEHPQHQRQIFNISY